MITTEIINETLQLNAPLLKGDELVLTSEAIEFVVELHRKFEPRRRALLRARQERQELLNQNQLPDFLPETSSIRAGEWKASPVPAALQNRRVEITGPVDRKMIINGLNSGANVFMADFEDANSPTWRNCIEGQLNLMEAVRETLSYESPEGKLYKLNSSTAVLKVRPRGWHLLEKHLLVDGEFVSASLFDFGLHIFHNGKILAKQGKGPFFYLPKLESHLEARLWNDVFLFAEEKLKLQRGVIKATVLIETILAVFEMEEIIYELREHMAGLNAGRWDYLFSIIKKFRVHKNFITPDRAQLTMAVPFMNAYAKLLVKTCHKRGVHAMGGMAAFIPSKDEEVNRIAFEKVKADKEREALLGYDGTWVAHPKLVEIAKEEFDKVLGESPNQKQILHEETKIYKNQLLDISSAEGKITENGVRLNIKVALQYIESWLQGIGAAALNNLMEDAATAEISRAQLWQWIRHRPVIEGGKIFSESMYRQIRREELDSLLHRLQKEKRDVKFLQQAESILDQLVLNEKFEEFLTLKAYDHVL
ncbi:MAG: malate synthase A [Bacteroidetes bacterium]|nr:malate synthase A [Bacteroidota bacterium]